MANEINSGDQETYTLKEGLKVIDRFFEVPLDYSRPTGEKIVVFGRHIIPTTKAKTKEEEEKLPFIVYLQGGPGFEIGLQRNSGFAAEVYQEGYQVLWLDQRGTGLSTPLTPDTLPAHVKTDDQIAAYLKHFRQDNIVRDCEAIRKLLLGHKENPEDRKWTLLGQSFGGFCAITYLSFHSDGIKEVFLTGGLAPLVNDPDDVYAALVPRIVRRNNIYYEKYPRDIKRVRDIVAYLANNKVVLPSGGRLSPNRWQQLGMAFGRNGGIDQVHQIVLRASRELEIIGKIGYKTLQTIEHTQPFDGNPLYAIIHEAIYCQSRASRWSADRTIAQHSQFLWDHVKTLGDNDPIYFTGEMIFPAMFDDYVNLRPWKQAAELLAQDATWEPLYDLKQLSENKVKVSTATYFDDMFVDFNLAQDTASKIKGTEQYITNQLFHGGIGEDPKDVFKRLFQISKREYN
ncbi:alpha/beta-hydrolase [Macrolepiota fuliginosa MF-IS2]|uniref:Alpha/beta-hydrolase n=1 Tax=Macrolepiota fuliginosa MF-IS2 TaxID=1400762 RepID=A0A9P6C057_9AGAR|nr:alpha/beta-hydrolase [Macrolepiota fuliginosa MF-IS2]